MRNITNGPISDICGCMIKIDLKAMKLRAYCVVSVNVMDETVAVSGCFCELIKRLI